jgi:hypothetical protein
MENVDPDGDLPAARQALPRSAGGKLRRVGSGRTDAPLRPAPAHTEVGWVWVGPLSHSAGGGETFGLPQRAAPIGGWRAFLPLFGRTHPPPPTAPPLPASAEPPSPQKLPPTLRHSWPHCMAAFGGSERRMRRSAEGLRAQKALGLCAPTKAPLTPTPAYTEVGWVWFGPLSRSSGGGRAFGLPERGAPCGGSRAFSKEKRGRCP